MLKKLLLIASAAVGGIYLTSDEGKNARESLLKKKSAFEPIIKDLINQANDVLDGSKTINSNEVKANIDLLVNEAKQSLIELELDKTAEVIKEAIRISSKKIRLAMDETEKSMSTPKKDNADLSIIDKKNENKKNVTKLKTQTKAKSLVVSKKNVVRSRKKTGSGDQTSK